MGEDSGGMRTHPHQISTPGRQALLLLIKGHDKEQKRFGFGRDLDPSIHQAMTRRILDVLTRFSGTDIVIVQSGDVPLLPQARYLPERGDNFNDRFLNALRDTFALGYRRVVIVGGDIPTLGRTDIEMALAHDGLVIGPTFDGGFYLAGLEPDDLGLFDRLPWRTRSLLDALLERINAEGRICRWLTRRQDIDNAAAGRSAASLLMRLVRQWLKGRRPHKWPRSFLASMPDKPLPDPRYCCLAPPGL
jgi:glycosyltransferase A (GT-A) superfamily protein (DUF2064 family)